MKIMKKRIDGKTKKNQRDTLLVPEIKELSEGDSSGTSFSCESSGDSDMKKDGKKKGKKSKKQPDASPKKKIF